MTHDESTRREHGLIAPETPISLLADGTEHDIRSMDSLYCSFVHLSH